ncbi:MAG: hypothetical protein QG632_240 [Candidatus Dependentiae bacterium]|nr:hypothetical protein [Candidatus Dependentiae bacterium]
MKKFLMFLCMCGLASVLFGLKDGGRTTKPAAAASVGVTQKEESISGYLKKNRAAISVASVKYQGRDRDCYLINGMVKNEGSASKYQTFLLPCDDTDNDAFAVAYEFMTDAPCFKKISRTYAEIAVMVQEPVEQIKPLQEVCVVYSEILKKGEELVLPIDSPVLGYAWALLAEERFAGMKPEAYQALKEQGFDDSDMKKMLSGVYLEVPAFCDGRRCTIHGYLTRDPSAQESFFLCIPLEKTYKEMQVPGHGFSIFQNFGPAVYRVNTTTKQLTPVNRQEISHIEQWLDYSTSEKDFYFAKGLTLNGLPILFSWPAETVKDPVTGKESYKFVGTDLLQDKPVDNPPVQLMDKETVAQLAAADAKAARALQRDKWGIAGGTALMMMSVFLLQRKMARLVAAESELLDLENQGEEVPLELLNEVASLRRWRKGLQFTTVGGMILAAFFATRVMSAPSLR